MDGSSSNKSGLRIRDLTVSRALRHHEIARHALHEEELSRVSVEGYDTSLHVDDITMVLSSYFRSCESIMIPRDPVSGVVERCGFVYFSDEASQEKAVALSGLNVGFPYPGKKLGGWEVFVKAVPKLSFKYSPEQLAASHRLTTSPDCGFHVTGYPTSLHADDVMNALFRLFRSCGEEILYLTVEPDSTQPLLLRRTAFVCLLGKGALKKAVGLDGSDVGGWNVAVSTAPKPNQDIDPAYSLPCF